MESSKFYKLFEWAVLRGSKYRAERPVGLRSEV